MEEKTAEQKIDSPEMKEIKDDLDKYKAIAALQYQEGGKLLLNTLKQDILNDIESIISLFRAPELDLRCAVAKLKSDLSLYRTLKRSDENVTLAEEALSKLLETEKNNT